MLKNLYIKGFHQFFGRARKRAAVTLKERVEEIRNRAPGQLQRVFSDAVEPEKITGKPKSRDRVYSADVTFWALLGQVMRGGSLREAVREVQASVKARGSAMDVGESTASYSDARQRMPQSSLEAVQRRVCQKFQRPDELLPGRRVWAVDATSVQLADTPKNQEAYPQPTLQKAGCGFPVMQIVGLFNMNTAALEHFVESPWKEHEGGMFLAGLSRLLQQTDVIVGDRLYCSFLNTAVLQQQGVDCIFRLNSQRKWPGSHEGEEDIVVQWQRPALAAMPDYISEQEYEAMPEQLPVRYVRFTLRQKGFRPRILTLATTLMEVPAAELAQLYLKRWGIELCFDDIKTTMEMDFIAAKSPAMAMKLVTTAIIAYNLIRLTMQQAAIACGHRELTRLSFKGSLDAILQFCSHMRKASKDVLSSLKQKLFQSIAADLLPDRPGRIEPRVRKRRPKPFPLMTKPRQVLIAQIVASQAPC